MSDHEGANGIQAETIRSETAQLPKVVEAPQGEQPAPTEFGGIRSFPVNPFRTSELPPPKPATADVLVGIILGFLAGLMFGAVMGRDAGVIVGLVFGPIVGAFDGLWVARVWGGSGKLKLSSMATALIRVPLFTLVGILLLPIFALTGVFVVPGRFRDRS
jgi:uncharacterized membrane protein YeaQ/YmgE (transglycosylase-associated protein family)